MTEDAGRRTWKCAKVKNSHFLPLLIDHIEGPQTTVYAKDAAYRVIGHAEMKARADTEVSLVDNGLQKSCGV
jgi:hypothetical protein